MNNEQPSASKFESALSNLPPKMSFRDTLVGEVFMNVTRYTVQQATWVWEFVSIMSFYFLLIDGLMGFLFFCLLMLGK